MDPLRVLLRPPLRALRRSFRPRASTAWFRAGLLGVLTVGFWAVSFFLVRRVLEYFRGVPEVGDLLALKLLSMVFLVLLSVVAYSALLTALSAFYLAEDLSLLMTTPVPPGRLFMARFLAAAVEACWMPLVFGLPVFLAYGAVYAAPLAYGFWLAGTLAAFFLVPVGVGVLVAILLMRILPARRTRDVLFLLGLTVLAVVFLMLRFLQPERLVNPEGFATLTLFLAELRAPSSVFLPSAWATEILRPFFQAGRGEQGFYALLLASSGLASLVFAYWASLASHRAGYSRAQEARRARARRHGRLDRLLRRSVGCFSSAVGVVVLKDLRAFLRDTQQWSQGLLLLALIVLYLFNMKALPLDWFSYGGLYLHHMIAFLNLALVGVVLAAVAARFAYPSVSLEGRAFWILASAPVHRGRILWGKYVLFAVPLLVLAETLVVASNLLLGVKGGMMALSVMAAGLLVLGITGLAVGLGAAYPDLRAEDPARIPLGFGGLLYMILALGFIGAVTALLAWPAYHVALVSAGRAAAHAGHWIALAAAGTAVLGLTLATWLLPMGVGRARLQAMEIP